MGAVSGALFSQYYTAGTTAYAAGDYQTAAEQLTLAVESDPEGVQTNHYDALYFLGFAYFNQGNTAKSDEIFREIVTKYPAQAGNVQGYISSGSADTGGQPDSQTGSQGEASMNGGDTAGGGQGASGAGQGDGGITVWDESGDTTGGDLGYDPADVAWTDPNTGLHYDMYGNLLG